MEVVFCSIYNSRVEATLTNLNLLELLVSKDLDPESQEFSSKIQQKPMLETATQAPRGGSATREMNAENNAMQMQLEYSRLAQADANRSQDRKDKAIMALLGGLGNLGAGFTV